MFKQWSLYSFLRLSLGFSASTTVFLIWGWWTPIRNIRFLLSRRRAFRQLAELKSSRIPTWFDTQKDDYIAARKAFFQYTKDPIEGKLPYKIWD
jgi:hypothetical protein